MIEIRHFEGRDVIICSNMPFGGGLTPPIGEVRRHYWPIVTNRGAKTHKEDIKAMPIEDKKPFSDERKRLARKALKKLK
jgi:hypothetical protein